MLIADLITVSNAADRSTQQTTVTVSRSGSTFEVISRSRIPASRETAWAILTDYDSYPKFVPGMTASAYLSKSPLRVEQRGVFGVLFLRKRIHSVLDVVEEPMSRLRLVSVEGNLRKLDTEILIAEEGNEVVLDYRSIIEPDFWVPPIIGNAVVRAAIRKKLIAVAREIERRARLQERQ